jgi:peroxiredoxin Q/BCP
MQCRSHVAQLGRLYPQFQAAGAEVLVILGDTPERVTRYGASLHVPFPILADAAHEVYHRFDLERAYLVIQRTASVVVDRTGRIQYIKRATNPQTWLQESQELLRVVQGLGNG